MTLRLRDEVAIVTGSTSGLGREIATLFAEQGASVIVSGRRVDAGEAIVAGLARESGANHLFVASDLTTSEGREALVDRTVARFGRLTVLVNNAVSPTAIAHDGVVTAIDHELWHDMLSVTLVATAEMCRLSIPHVINAGGGSIVNVSAKSASLARPGRAAYSTRRRHRHARPVDRRRLLRQGVRCNALQPGYIIHEGRDAGMTDARRAELEGMQLTRLATARDVALAALFLASRRVRSHNRHHAARRRWVDIGARPAALTRLGRHGRDASRTHKVAYAFGGESRAKCYENSTLAKDSSFVHLSDDTLGRPAQPSPRESQRQPAREHQQVLP